MADLATTARGYVAEASGHVTVIVDRTEQVLLGVAIAGPAATETIHEAVLAIKARIPIPVLADTIHAFPTTARVLGAQFMAAARVLGVPGSEPGPRPHWPAAAVPRPFAPVHRNCTPTQAVCAR